MQPQSPEKLLLTTVEAADVLSISRRKLWDLTAPRGPIPCLRLNRSVRYSVADLRVFIDQAATRTGEH